VRDRVTLQCSPRELLVAVYAAADAVVFPVRWAEPWGLVPLEAMAVGRPVVATATGGAAEYLRHEHNCLVFEPGDARALGAAVTRLRDDAALRSQLRAGGVATVARFTDQAFQAAVRRQIERAGALAAK
jgi:glycosyltransferase involved in cell wall biosynthesis